ncbi:MAG: hypothetical protein A2Y40_10345 [Candidatus Margulisbacteria bacterium GWF2_35_9]|nr:MAG: hypothetical protein A2Y40_10345 [Candidatus Margulisbacteria bacterium GWF2_35_9]
MIKGFTQYFIKTFGKIRPEGILLSSFILLIIVGTILLWLPFCHSGKVGFSEALFTSVSAVCVTGLTVVDTRLDFTFFGQVVILILIQLGGLGVMTFAALTFELLGKRLSLAGQSAMTNSLVHEELLQGFRRYFRKILLLLFSIELIGAIALFVSMMPSQDILYSMYSAIFHSVSAFCNAGFSIYTDNLTGFSQNYLFIGIIAILIIIGGIGHPVIFDLVKVFKVYKKARKPFFSLLTIHTRITVGMTLFLLVFGSIILAVTNIANNSFDLSSAIFQSVSARTAGFNTIIIGQLPLSSLLVLVVLMFIGGSPGSSAGGVKTTTFAIWITQIFSWLKGNKSVIIQDRYIPKTLVRRSTTIISLAILLNIIGIFVLSITEPGISLNEILFEQVSAFGTVGLSTGLTPQLSEWGRIWIIVTMFIGRTGSLTAVIFLLRKNHIDVKYPEGKVMIG